MLFLNRQLITLLLLAEFLIIIIFLIGLIIAGYFNIFYLIGFSFFVLVIAGLELAMNLLILAL